MAKIEHDIERYLKGELTAAEMHALEKKALNDPFLADALEGAELNGNENFASDLQELNRRISAKQSPSGWWSPLRIAASLVILIASVSLYLTVFRQQDEHKPVATLTPKSKQPIASTERKKESPSLSADKEKSKPNLLSLNRPATAKHSAERREQSADNTSRQSQEPEPVPSASPQVSSAAAPDESGRQHPATEAEEIIDVAKARKSDSRGAATMDLSDFKSKKEVAVKYGNPGSSPITGRVSVPNRSASGVRVQLKGTKIATQTDAQGNYEIAQQKNKPGQSLVFSLNGYATTEVDADDQSNINVQLSGESGKPAEVVVGNNLPVNDQVDPTTAFAQPVGGEKAFDDYLEKNLQYPEEALKKKIEGRVMISFNVRKDSTLSDFTIVHGIGSGCEEELIRLVKSGPQWMPLKQSDDFHDSKVYVRFKFALPK